MALLAAVGVSQQKSVTELAIVVEYVETPTTLERATARAHAVVRARGVGSQFRKLIEPGAPVPHVSTAYASDGRGRQQVTSLPGHEWYPNWSPDGSRILFIDSNTEGVSVGRARGQRVERPEGSIPTD